MDGRVGTTFVNQGPVTLSPSSDAFSHTHPDHFRNSTPQGNSSLSNKRHLPSNGTTAPNFQTHAPSRFRPRNPFDIYVAENKPILLAERRDLNHPDFEGEAETMLARGWAAADNDVRADYSARFEEFRRHAEGEQQRENGSRPPVVEGEQRVAETADEDVEMVYDPEIPAPVPSSGFTAVNN